MFRKSGLGIALDKCIKTLSGYYERRRGQWKSCLLGEKSLPFDPSNPSVGKLFWTQHCLPINVFYIFEGTKRFCVFVRRGSDFRQINVFRKRTKYRFGSTI